MELYLGENNGVIALDGMVIRFSERHPLEDPDYAVMVMPAATLERFLTRATVMLQRRKSPGSKKWENVQVTTFETWPKSRTITLDPTQPLDPTSQLIQQLEAYAAERGGQLIITGHDQPDWEWKIEWCSRQVFVTCDGSNRQTHRDRYDHDPLYGSSGRELIEDVREFFVTRSTWAIEYIETNGQRRFSQLHIGPNAKLEEVIKVLDTLALPNPR